jgi:hypothetical protein
MAATVPSILQKTTPKPPSPAELKAITQRGQLLAEYDRIAVQTTDILLAQPPDPALVRRFLARKKDKKWTVVFGKLNDSGERFQIAAQIAQDEPNGLFTMERFPTPREEGGYWAEAARAVETALMRFRPGNRAYNIAVLPAPQNQWFVYVLPAQTKADYYPHGGDFRYRVSKDGLKLLETRQMHKTLIEVKTSANMAAHFHAATRDDKPEDSDVYHVLVRKPAVREIIASKNFVFEIKTDGTIRYVGPVKDLLSPSPPASPKPPSPTPKAPGQ